MVYHVPIMAGKVINGLDIKPGGVYLDCTLGGGGHSELILKSDSTVRLIGLDKDSDAIEYNSRLVQQYGDRVTLVKTDYAQAIDALDRLGIDQIDGVLMDLGISSHQIDTAERGFSYRMDAPLDMRMDQSNDLTARTVVNEFSVEELTRVLRVYGEEPFAHRIAQRIAENRVKTPIETTGQLAEIIDGCVPAKFKAKQGHPAKRTFQAIRIVVNGELVTLNQTINDLVERLKTGGRFAVLTFHSLEDRIVKQTFKLLATDCICDKSLPVCVCHHKASLKLITGKPLTADEQELQQNTRAASAKLRIAEKV